MLASCVYARQVPPDCVPVTTTQCIRRATPDVIFICSVADE